MVNCSYLALDPVEKTVGFDSPATSMRPGLILHPQNNPEVTFEVVT